jgi:hypothetical protein
MTPVMPTHGRTRRTRLFSQTTKPPTEQEEQSVTKRATTTTKSSISSSIILSTISSTINSSTTTTPITKKTSKAAFNKFAATTTKGPDLATKPDYENIHGPLGKTIDNMFLYVFRTKLAEYVGVDSKLPKTDFNGLIELSAALNSRYSDRMQIQKIAQQTLRKCVDILVGRVMSFVSLV